MTNTVSREFTMETKKSVIRKLTWCDQQNLTHLPALIQPLTEQDELTALTQLDKKLRPPGSKCAAAFSIFEVQ